jgi:nucleoid-associated protein YgaU
MEKAKLKWQCWIPPVSGEIECQFNPSELKISKEASWEGEKSPSFNSPYLQFAGGESATYSLSLFFDTYSHKDVKDVREYTNQLLALTLRGAGRSMFIVPFSNPPFVTFIWGKITLFDAVVEKVEISYTMFSSDGLPIRAKADVSFKQQDFWDDIIPAQNPTSRTDSRKTRRVNSSQRLDQIAYEEYGDARYWRLLAEANAMDDPFQLVDGQLLVIPQDK